MSGYTPCRMSDKTDEERHLISYAARPVRKREADDEHYDHREYCDDHAREFEDDGRESKVLEILVRAYARHDDRADKTDHRDAVPKKAPTLTGLFSSLGAVFAYTGCAGAGV